MTARTSRRRTLIGGRSALAVATAFVLGGCPDDGHVEVDASLTGDAESVVVEDAAQADAEDTPQQEDGEVAPGCEVEGGCDAAPCASGECIDSGPPPCTDACPEAERCTLATGECVCTPVDADMDGEASLACGGTDCDDSDGEVFSRAWERCNGNEPETLERDEDCDPLTFYDARAGIDHDADGDGHPDADHDGDGYVSEACLNRASDGTVRSGDDCEDDSPNVHPNQTEACNYVDDNCAGGVDEREVRVDGVLQIVERGLQQVRYPDVDGDGHGDDKATAELACSSVGSHVGFVFEDYPSDMDDGEPRIYRGAPERCDGLDNDGMNGTDAEDTKLEPPANRLPGVGYVCKEGHWQIDACPSADVTWCGGDVAQGCSVNATSLRSCRACNSDCKFACGQRGCEDVVELAMGNEHSCARGSEGRVACWGATSLGRLGHESTDMATLPTWLPRVADARALALGFQHSCAVIGDERGLWCWGSNATGQLGAARSAVANETVTPVRTQSSTSAASPMVGVRSVALGAQHSCAVLATGELVCFGQQAGGRLGNLLTTAAVRTPAGVRRNLRVELNEWDEEVELADPVQDIVSVSLGDSHGCAINRSGVVECWGDDSAGQLGDQGAAGQWPALRVVPGVPPASQVAAGHFHSCALSDGRVYCWGSERFGQLGPRDAAPSGSPAPIVGVEDAVAIAAGHQSTCALLAGGAIRCWGDNSAWQLGPQSGASFQAEGSRFVAVSLGGEHGCALRADHEVQCWGANGSGQLGIGSQSAATQGTLQDLRPVQGTGR